MVKLLGIFIIFQNTAAYQQRGEMIGGRYAVVNGLQSTRPLPIIIIVALSYFI